MSSAARRAPTDDGDTRPSVVAPPEDELADMPTRVSVLGDLEVRALFAATEGETASSIDVSGLELEDLPTRAVPSTAPTRAVSLSDDGILVPIEVFDPLPETGVRSKTRSPAPASVPEPVPESLFARLARVIADFVGRR